MGFLNPKFQEAAERTIREHLVEYLKIVVFWCSIFSLIFMTAFGSWTHAFVSFGTSFVIAASCATFCYWGSYLLNLVIHAVFYKIKGAPIGKSVLRGIATSYLFLVPGLYVGFKLANTFRTGFGHKGFEPDFQDYRAGIFYGLFVSGGFLLFEILEKAKNAEREAEIRGQKLENEKLKAQVSALTAQMNPHLLFNSLNTIASTISTSPVSAEEMTLQLSELYRGVLAAAKGEVHSLDKELSICRSYLEIEKKRFGERVSYEFDIAEGIRSKNIQVPVLMLQPLVENAVKHGLSPKRLGGKVSLKIDKNGEELIVKVIDDGVGSSSSSSRSDGTGTGLKNSESRIYLKYGERGKFDFRSDEKGARVLIQIPMELANA